MGSSLSSNNNRDGHKKYGDTFCKIYFEGGKKDAKSNTSKQ